MPFLIRGVADRIEQTEEDPAMQDICSTPQLCIWTPFLFSHLLEAFAANIMVPQAYG